MPGSPVYLDHAATTPVLPEVIEAMTPRWPSVGNPSSLHTSGRRARRVVEESRESIGAGRWAPARPRSCSPPAAPSPTTWRSRACSAPAGTADPRRVRLLVSAVEHHAVLDCVDFLVASEGAVVSWLEVDAQGRVRPETVRAAIEADPASVALVSVMWANNEVGTVQPVAEVVAVAHEHGIPVHTDAVQAVGAVPVDFAACGADLLTFSGHKIGGPQGIGVLLARRDVRLVPLSHGGGQERQLRSGTLDTPAIRGLAVAVGESVGRREAEAARLVALRDRLLLGAMASSHDVTVSGDWREGDGLHRLPGNAHLLVPGCDGDSLLYLLDAAGVECSTGSACQAGVPQPSHVLLAMGVPEAHARGALRVTLGHTSSDADVDAFLAALPAALDRARRAQVATSAGARR